MKKRTKKVGPRGRPKGKEDKHQKIVSVVIMPYYGSEAKGLPCAIDREDNEAWMDFYERYTEMQSTFPLRTWIKFKYETKIVQHYATSK